MHTQCKQWRYVFAESTRYFGSFAFLLFRYEDGSWNISTRYQTVSARNRVETLDHLEDAP